MRFATGRASSEGGARQAEQLGQTQAVRPDGCLLWVLSEKAAEAGPAPTLAQELSARLDEPVHTLATPLEETPLVPAVQSAVIHQFAPSDSDGTVKRFLDHWAPDFCVVIGFPNRPRLLTAADKADVPLFHASPDRVPDVKLRRFPSYLGAFHTCFAASAAEATALEQQLSGKDIRIETTGPLTDTVHALPCNEAECDDLARLLGGRPVWLAAEIDGIEADVVETAHRKAFRSAHRLLLIIVPRPGTDTEGMVGRLERNGWRVALRSKQQEPDPDIQIYIADTEGELGLWYRLSPVSFVGGSLHPGSTPTDPYAPAALGSAVLHGKNTGVNSARFDRLELQGASQMIRNAEDLGEAVISLLAPDKVASLAQAGWATTTESAPVVDRIVDVMEIVWDEKGL